MRLGRKIIYTSFEYLVKKYIRIDLYRRIRKNFSGGDSEEVTPVPISNTEVKLFSADGTAWEAVWESRTLPENLFIARSYLYSFGLF